MNSLASPVLGYLNEDSCHHPTLLIRSSRGMVYNSAVGSTPAFLVAATGSIPAFSLPVRIFGQAVLSKESATPGVTIVYGSFLLLRLFRVRQTDWRRR